jgi:hypothetical protein
VSLRYAIYCALIRRAHWTPYDHLPGYMARYWFVPYADPALGRGCGPVSPWRRPIAWLLQKCGIAVRIHHILASDDDRAFHDHPWAFISVVLEGAYTEVTPYFNKSGVYIAEEHKVRRAGSVAFRRAKSWHRIALGCGPRPTTLFITFRKSQMWGFMPQPHRNKVPFKEFLK